MKTSNFFDINTLITINSKVWIIDKLKPNNPILKISKSEFNLLKKGVYKKDNIKFDISGKTYWFNQDLIDKIKIRCKNADVDISSLSFSMQEFMNKEIVDNDDFSIHMEHIEHLKNVNEDIYIICSKNNKANYEVPMVKLEKKLEEIGISIKKTYFLSETFYNRDEDDINLTKVRLLIQHLIGLKTKGDKFTEEELEKYDIINFYDDELHVIELAKNANEVLQFLISNSEDEIKNNVKEVLKANDCILFVNQVTFNRVNRFLKTKVVLQWQNLIRKFESFIIKY
jgi:hypothetical protein